MEMIGDGVRLWRFVLAVSGGITGKRCWQRW